MIYFDACELVLPKIKKGVVDVVLTDPPYGLGKTDPTPKELQLYLSEDKVLATGDFMGKEWDIPSVAVWKQCYRVLRAKGLLLSFAGTRTTDIISLGIQAAGFHRVGEILWVHSQGFPKGGEISKKIDRLKGKEPRVVGPDPERGRRNKKKPRFNGQDYAGGKVWQGASEVPLTEPGSEEGALWKGWGTQLKPSWEPILVYSKGKVEMELPRFIYCSKPRASETTLEGAIENKHPTKKPLQLMRELVRLASAPEELVLDPYLGSGTTAVAAIEEGRKYLGSERDPNYYKTATARVQLVQAELDSRKAQRGLFDFAMSFGAD
jgi:DNA modification methylase